MKEVSFLLRVFSMMVLLRFCFSRVSAITCIQKEREALLQFKKSFGTDPFRLLASWSGTNCCNWYGVGCNQTSGHVTMVDLRNNWLELSTSFYIHYLDSSLLELKYLNYLDLSGNNFDLTQISNVLGSMVELTYLNLSNSIFDAKVLPRQLGNLTKLVVLDLSNYFFYNKYAGLKALNRDVEWISHLSSLQFFSLSGKDLSEASNLMQVLSSLPLLSSLILTDCSLQNNQLSFGSMNSSFLSRIQHLDLSSNNFHGPIPKVFHNMTSLKFLDLSNNKLTSTSIDGGVSSFILGNNCILKALDLSNNYDLGGDVFGSYENESMACRRYDLQVLKLEGTSLKTKIPDWLGKFKDLRSLSLSSSHIYGSIPASLGNLSRLEDLDLSNNALTGAIPTSFGRLLNLRILILEWNRLEELGQECFIQLQNLEELDISNNSLKGVLEEAHFANLSQLNFLFISYNEHLLLDVKSNWVPPFQLRFLDASSCIGCFQGAFPEWLRTQNALVRLWLYNTSISSAFPTWLRAQNLIILDLSHNQIVGPIPTSVGDQMPNLRFLYLNHNLINDSLPLSFCKLKILTEVDLSNNEFSGMVQGCWLTSNLMYLDLSSNNFSGTFPYSHGNLSRVEMLNLRSNKFEGSMPSVLKDARDLNFLDLGMNKFSGNIPMWVGNNLGDLKCLMLRGNLFNGTIPSSLCNLTWLTNLDLAHNQLEGPIPQNIRNFYAMTEKLYAGFSFSREADVAFSDYREKSISQFIKSNELDYTMKQLERMVNIDLSHNYLVGSIPSEISKLKELVGLNLSHNNLTGTIPAEIGEIESLESLDLSFNQLSGPIPRSISRLNSLGDLKLSRNNLSGEIPQEGHLSTFNEASSFDDNPYLCGDPLPKKCTTENSFEPSFTNIENQDEEEDKWDKWLLCIVIILGYVVGFWGVIGVLMFKRSLPTRLKTRFIQQSNGA
ncbi:LRR receptor-like serine/threonine-protein kinase GSO1 [Cucurbita maxima]|uniref:LRR receptor-like serine/threonine-protein kinase GSO1 n=1 Tax=Cucurbita maxima TaxID=3661 RepID=A0A6J1I4N6_CUCMA|nr:LRR receptor-like serine/threonine-protein kinase GSO1 [Cucurbita maxima]